MSIEVKAAFGASMSSLGDVSQVPVQILTALVLAELLNIREESQRQQVEFMAQQNAESKKYNDLLGTVQQLTSNFPDEKTDTGRKIADETPNPISKADAEAYAKAMRDAAKEGVSFAEKLKNSSDISASAKAYYAGRAELADAAKSMDMLPGGGTLKDYTAVAMGGMTRGTLDTVRTKLKSAAEGITTNSQLFMIKLQQLVSLVDSIKTALSQYVKTSGDSQKEIAQKM